MSVISRADAWIGLKLFHPPIIRFCQWTGYTQHRLHRDMWFAWGLWAAWSANTNHRSPWTIGLILFAAVLMGLRAALLPPSWPESGSRWVRYLFGAWLLLTLPVAVVSGAWLRWAGTLWLLFAEYAATISSIPPREPKSNRAARPARNPT